jgi:hypothetical protein
MGQATGFFSSLLVHSCSGNIPWRFFIPTAKYKLTFSKMALLYLINPPAPHTDLLMQLNLTIAKIFYFSAALIEPGLGMERLIHEKRSY